jgi:HEAT repeat protein
LAQVASAASSEHERRAAWNRLAALGDRLESAVGAAAARGDVELPERLFLELLPTVAPVYRDLAELAADDVATRRAAATRLLYGAQREPLSELAASRLTEVTLRSADPLVWQTALEIAATDRRERARQLALAAVGHPEGTVRRSACELLGDWGAASSAPALRGALDDSDESVAATAAVALGRCGGPQDAPRLMAGLQSPRPEMRLAAAEGLALLGDEAGKAALERLALDDRAVVRQRAAEAMGRMADPQFVAALVARLGDQAAVRRAALVSLRATVPDQAAKITPAGQGESTEAEEIAAWRAWAAEGVR